MSAKPTTQQKLQTVYKYNTYFNKVSDFEDKYQDQIETQIDNVCDFQTKIAKSGFSKELLDEVLQTKDGLDTILTITSVSLEMMCGIVMMVRVMDNVEEFETLFCRSKWHQDPIEKDWSPNKIKSLTKKNKHFRKFIVNLFTEAFNSDIIRDILPKFEWRKLNPDKFSEISSVPRSFIDTMVRYKLKGSYAASKENNAEVLVENALKESNLSFAHGDLPLLTKNASSRKRTIDFILPDKDSPSSCAESSYVQTTASGMGDKAKTEIQVGGLIKEYYPGMDFHGFIDGVGWLRRPKDLLRMCEAFDDVFTFHPVQLKRYVNVVCAKMEEV